MTTCDMYSTGIGSMANLNRYPIYREKFVLLTNISTNLIIGTTLILHIFKVSKSDCQYQFTLNLYNISEPMEAVRLLRLWPDH